MTFFSSIFRRPISRRGVLKGGIFGAAGLALYAGEVERHWIEVTHHDVSLAGLPQAFEGMRIVQLSDIHLDEYTEPRFLRDVVERVNRMQPDAVLLTGDFVSECVLPRGIMTDAFAKKQMDHSVQAAWQCAAILKELKCERLFAILGNHDHAVGAGHVTEALTAHGIVLLRNAFVPIEREGGRIWLAGLDDPVEGDPKPELAIPASIRNVPNEPVVLMCHAPDYADTLLATSAGQAVSLMLSGHTHGGQVRLPLLGAVELPELGHKYVEGWFRLGGLQLYVNRGIGTVGLPFRFNCPPEITMMTLRRG